MSLWSFTVPTRTAYVAYRHGIVQAVLPTGRHRRGWGMTYIPVDLRERLHAIAPQDVPVQDGITVRVSAAVRWRVSDPVAFVERTEDPLAAVHLATQVALREALAPLTVAEVVARGAGAPQVDLRTVGVLVHEVVIKDVILPAEVRAAAMELVTARSRGLAQLEAARAETAALRSLANGARLLDEHPALARLRLVQAAPYGSRVVLAVGDGAVNLVTGEG
jgi:regulator of protease activity HflC (stomatin/prohibitin superfamily)